MSQSVPLSLSVNHLFVTLGLVCMQVISNVSSGIIIRQILYDLYSPYFSPEVMVQVIRRMMGTLCDAYQKWHAYQYVHAPLDISKL